MSKLSFDYAITDDYDRQNFAAILRSIMFQVNPLSEGLMSARYAARASMPVSVSAAVGDIVWDSNTTVRASVAPGLAASYVRLGWVCTAGSPTAPTFVEMRVLTGT